MESVLSARAKLSCQHLQLCCGESWHEPAHFLQTAAPRVKIPARLPAPRVIGTAREHYSTPSNVMQISYERAEKCIIDNAARNAHLSTLIKAV
jgi:hypothetical protein